MLTNGISEETMSRILAIDAGNKQSGYAVIEMPNLNILEAGKIDNNELLKAIPLISSAVDIYALEMIASYGKAVGKDVFDTCVWIGRFIQAAEIEHTIVYRKEEKLRFCNDIRAKDTNIRRAMIDEFAKHDFKTGKGTKKNPDTFYGVKKDAWEAIAVGIVAYEREDINELY